MGAPANGPLVADFVIYPVLLALVSIGLYTTLSFLYRRLYRVIKPVVNYGSWVVVPTVGVNLAQLSVHGVVVNRNGPAVQVLADGGVVISVGSAAESDALIRALAHRGAVKQH